jgi:flavin reductase (DIM6/NTAB) family NADH-FMN oxidoreductase RutF
LPPCEDGRESKPAAVNVAGAGNRDDFRQAPPNSYLQGQTLYVGGVDPREFRDTLGSFPTGVAVVTAVGPQGPAGLTTNAFSSLSLDPPLVLVCFDHGSRTLAVVRDSGRFAVNILRAGDEDLATLFAGKVPHPEKFAAVTHTVDHGVPVLDSALAWLVCDLQALHAGGDHEIGVGAVTALGHDPGGEPLVFHAGRFRGLA